MDFKCKKLFFAFPFNFFLLIGLFVTKGKRYTRDGFKFNQEYNYQQSSFVPPQNNIDKYYDILESLPSDDFLVIKSRYRELMKRYHYDTIVSKNLPEDMIKFAEKVVLLLKDEKLRRSMGESGRARALELFSADRMAKEYLDAIEE